MRNFIERHDAMITWIWRVIVLIGLAGLVYLRTVFGSAEDVQENRRLITMMGQRMDIAEIRITAREKRDDQMDGILKEIRSAIATNNLETRDRLARIEESLRQLRREAR